MNTPRRSRPYWPDALETFKDTTSGLKDWSWAAERLEQSHNYWIATASSDGHPHLMVIWGIWWRDAFWFSTGRGTRKAKNIVATSSCVIGTEKAGEAVILEGPVSEISDRAIWKEIIPLYNQKYGGDSGPLLEKSNSTIFQVTPKVVFGQDENVANFNESVTRWTFE